MKHLRDDEMRCDDGKEERSDVGGFFKRSLRLNQNG